MRLLYLDLDTLRPDHLGCYGYSRNTSPNIDKMAQQGVKFTNYYASDAPCGPSRAAMMSGMFGIHNGAVSHDGSTGDMRKQGSDRQFRSFLDQSALPNIFRRAGMKTALISPFAERHSAFQYYAGFTEMYNTQMGGMESAEHVTPTVLDWIERNGSDDDWYLHINYWDPHTPYRAPEGFGNPFKDDPLPEWATDEILEKHWGMPGPHTAQDISMWNNHTNPDYPRAPGEAKGREGFRSMIDGYDCGIKYMDDHIGEIFAALEKQGVMDDVIVVISSDHGENLGELGIYAEHGTADNITCRIPFIVRWPGKQQNVTDDAFHYNLDWAPTLAEMLGEEKNEYWDGKSFASAITEGKSEGHEELIISQCAHVCQRSVRHGDWLYMKTYHDGFHLFPDEMLFNLKTDPYEQNNVAEENPDVVRDLAYRYLKWHDHMMATQPFGNTEDPMRLVLKEGGPSHARGALKAYIERLKESGRSEHIEALIERHPREFERPFKYS